MTDTSNDEQPEIIQRAAETWGIPPERVVQFMLNTVVTGTRDYNPGMADCIHVLIVALNYQLNPFTKELYAIVDKGKVLPVVGVDGWAGIVNSRGNFNGAKFDAQDDENGNPYSCTCKIYCKDREHPVEVTEYFKECYVPPRGNHNGPWQSHPRRMLRHKAFIQCARIAFALTGIYDPDEADRMVTGQVAGGAETRVLDTTPDPLLITAGVQYNEAEVVEIPDVQPEEVAADNVEPTDAEATQVSTQELWERGEIE